MRFVTEHCARFAQKLPSRAVAVKNAEASREASLAGYRQILEQVPAGSIGIDVAAGLGFGTGLLADRSRKIIGLEFSEERLAAAREENAARGNIVWRQKDLNDIGAIFPLYEELVDYVVSLETIEHLFCPDVFLMAIRSSLKPGGLLMLSTPAVQTTDLNPYHVHDFTPDSLFGMFQAAGFEVTGSRLVSNLKPLSWGMKKEDRIMPNIVSKGLLLRNMAGVYAREPGKFLHRVGSLLRYQGFPQDSIYITARKR